jgi:hypothetical protein
MTTCPKCKVEMRLMGEGGIQKKIRQFKCPTCGGIYQTFGSVTAKYNDATEGWNCTACGSEIKARNVAHTVRDGFFAFSGSGEVNYEQVPYCPKCEKEPSFHGTAVTEDGKPTA